MTGGRILATRDARVGSLRLRAPWGDAGVERCPYRAFVPEQHLDHANVGLALQKMRGEAVPQGVQRDPLVDLGELERDDFGRPEPRAVGDAQRRLLLEAASRRRATSSRLNTAGSRRGSCTNGMSSTMAGLRSKGPSDGRPVFGERDLAQLHEGQGAEARLP